MQTDNIAFSSVMYFSMLLLYIPEARGPATYPDCRRPFFLALSGKVRSLGKLHIIRRVQYFHCKNVSIGYTEDLNCWTHMKDSPRTPKALNKLLKLHHRLHRWTEYRYNSCLPFKSRLKNTCTIWAQDTLQRHTDSFKKSSNIHIMKRKERRKKDRLGCWLINRL